jgi:glucose-1-phosphate cytidylyltransferase
MKAVILAGGFGTRISEETHLRPKPLIEIGGFPILWHIMKIYEVGGVKDFIICCGYKGYLIKEYFANYALHRANVSIDLGKNELKFHDRGAEQWKVTLIDTGEATMTGGRLLRIRDFLGDDEVFHFTYGDGLADVDFTALEKFHRAEGKFATVTGVQPPGKYGALWLDETKRSVEAFAEKPPGDGSWINGGFFLLNKTIFSYLQDDETVWEKEPLISLAKEGQLSCYRHDGFWQSMDTLRDKITLEEMWSSGTAPWKVW